MKVLIVGGGKRVYFLCRTFLAKGHAVTLISRDREDAARFSRRLKVTAVYGDGSDPAMLEEAGARGAEAVLAVTPNDEDNLVICQLAASRFSVPRTVALVNDPDNEEIFRTLGVAAFSVTPAVASLIEQQTNLDAVTNLIPVGGGKVNVTEVTLKAEFPVVGQTLRDVALPENSLVAIVLRDGEALVPRGSTTLRAGDRVVLITTPDNYGAALRVVTGETK
jgi:trk system potassium uptake protein TrkA